MNQNQNQLLLKEKRPDKVYKAETKDGRIVTNLRMTESGWVGCVNGFKMVWDYRGITGNGEQWTLFNIR